MIFAAWALGWLIAIPRMSYVIANEVNITGKVDGAEIALSLIIGSIVSIAWPIVWPGYRWYVYAQERGIRGAGLLVPPRPVRARREREECEQALVERERHIEQMERQLGIGRKRP